MPADLGSGLVRGYMSQPLTGKRLVGSKASIWVPAATGLSGRLLSPCAICFYSDSWLVLLVLFVCVFVCFFCCCCWFGARGTPCSPIRTGRCKEPQKQFLFVCLKKNPSWFSWLTSQSRRLAQGLPGRQLHAAESDPKVMSRASGSFHVEAE